MKRFEIEMHEHVASEWLTYTQAQRKTEEEEEKQ